MARAAEFIEPVREMAAVARDAAEANSELLASIEAVNAAMDGTVSDATRAAAADAAVAAASQHAADAATEQAASTAAAAEAQNAAAEAASRQAVANRAAASSAFDLGNFERILAETTTKEAAAAAAALHQTDALRRAQESLAGAEAVVAEGAARLAEVQAAGSVAAYQSAQAAKDAAESDVILAGAQEVAAEAARTHAAAETFLATAMTAAERDALGLTAANTALAASNKDAADKASASFRVWGTGIRLTGTALHWVIAGTAEFLAVAIPAAVAAGVGAFVLYQGAVEGVGVHLQSLYTATEAAGSVFGKTAGDVLGLGHAFQKAQDAANPSAYELLGSYINIAKSHMVDFANAGLQVAHMLDEFSARVTVDLGGTLGKQVQGLLANMVPDLQGLGQLFGNLGHSVLNLASEMPGLAEVLLGVFAGLSKLLSVLTNPAWYNFGGHLITYAMGLEEFYRWGGLVLNLMVRLTGQMAYFSTLSTGGFITRFGGYLLTMVRAGGLALVWAGAMIGRLAGLSAAFGVAGTAVARAGTSMAGFAAALTPLQGALIAGGIAALVGLVVVLGHVKDATDKWVASTNQAVRSASDLQVLPKIQSTLAENSIRLADAQSKLAASTQHVSTTTGVLSRYTQGASGAVARQAQDVQDLTQQQQTLSATAGRVVQNSISLGQSLHTTSGFALLLANAAGVNLQQAMAKNSTAFKIAVQQILNMEQGYRAMGASSDALGKDMTAVAIQAGLQNTQVQKLTQAWQAYLSLLTGGTSALAGFEQQITGLTTGTNKVSNILGKSSSDIKLSMQSFAESLTSFTGKGAQAWQNFDQVVGSSAQQFIDWMDNAAAVGMVSSTQLTGAIKGIVAQLLPFGAKSAAARAEISGLAQEAGGPATTNMKALSQWVHQGGMSARQLGQFVNATTVKLSNMAQVAANLGTVLQSDLISAFDSARLKSSGLTGDLAALSTAISTTGTKSSTTHGDIVKVINDMASMNVSVPTITALINSLGTNISEAGVKALIGSGKLGTLSGSITSTGGAAAAAAAHLSGLNAQINGLHSKTVTITTNEIHNIQTYKSQAHFGGARASGGPVMENVPYLVGEAGREIFVPDRPGVILPNPVTERTVSATAAPQVISLEATVHTPVYLDGQKIWENQQAETLRYGVRNGRFQSGAWAPNRP